MKWRVFDKKKKNWTQNPEKTRNAQLSVREALSSKKEESRKDAEAEFSSSFNYSDDDDEANFDSRMRQQILMKRKELGDLPPKPKLRNGKWIVQSIFR